MSNSGEIFETVRGVLDAWRQWYSQSVWKIEDPYRLSVLSLTSVNVIIIRIFLNSDQRALPFPAQSPPLASPINSKLYIRQFPGHITQVFVSGRFQRKRCLKKFLYLLSRTEVEFSVNARMLQCEDWIKRETMPSCIKRIMRCDRFFPNVAKEAI